MLLCALERRGILRVTGPDAPGFLDNLLTRDLDDVTPDKAGYAALLTPQGKIIATMIVHRDADGFLLDVACRDSEALLKRLQIYRLRAKVEITPEETLVPVASFGDGAIEGVALVPDPRLAGFCRRGYAPQDRLAAHDRIGSEVHYDAQRIAAGLLEAPCDFNSAEVFPHDIAMDLTHGVSFTKGCYIGQEVVSRMKHLAQARRRPVTALAGAPLGEGPLELTASGKPLGVLTSVSGLTGTGIARIDSVSQALAAGETIFAGGLAVSLAPPAHAGYRLAEEGEAHEIG